MTFPLWLTDTPGVTSWTLLHWSSIAAPLDVLCETQERCGRIWRFHPGRRDAVLLSMISFVVSRAAEKIGMCSWTALSQVFTFLFQLRPNLVNTYPKKLYSEYLVNNIFLIILEIIEWKLHLWSTTVKISIIISTYWIAFFLELLHCFGFLEMHFTILKSGLTRCLSHSVLTLSSLSLKLSNGGYTCMLGKIKKVFREVHWNIKCFRKKKNTKTTTWKIQNVNYNQRLLQNPSGLQSLKMMTNKHTLFPTLQCTA